MPSQYQIATSSDAEEFQNEVSRLLNDGFQLYGNLVVTPFRYEGDESKPNCVFSQALIREEKTAARFRVR